MERLDVIELINTLDVLETDSDGETLFYALVKDDEKTRKILKKLNAGEWHYQKYGKTDLIDIAPIAFEYGEWFNGTIFLEYAP